MENCIKDCRLGLFRVRTSAHGIQANQSRAKYHPPKAPKDRGYGNRLVGTKNKNLLPEHFAPIGIISSSQKSLGSNITIPLPEEKTSTTFSGRMGKVCLGSKKISRNCNFVGKMGVVFRGKCPEKQIPPSRYSFKQSHKQYVNVKNNVALFVGLMLWLVATISAKE